MRTLATFRLFGGPGTTAAGMTERLGVSPTFSAEAGSPGRFTDRTHDRAVWYLSSADAPLDGVDLAEHFGRLLDRLEPATSQLWELVREGCAADWFCYLGSRAVEQPAALGRALLSRLVTLPGDVVLDVYSDDAD